MKKKSLKNCKTLQFENLLFGTSSRLMRTSDLFKMPFFFDREVCRDPIRMGGYSSVVWSGSLAAIWKICDARPHHPNERCTYQRANEWPNKNIIHWCTFSLGNHRLAKINQTPFQDHNFQGTSMLRSVPTKSIVPTVALWSIISTTAGVVCSAKLELE